MKNKTVKATRGKFTILNQVCNLIPPHLVPKIARQTKVDEQARAFTPRSHTVALPQAQLSRCISLNDVERARELRARLRSGEIAVLDKAYVDFRHLGSPDQWGLFWVTRAKDNMAYFYFVKIRKEISIAFPRGNQPIIAPRS